MATGQRIAPALRSKTRMRRRPFYFGRESRQYVVRKKGTEPGRSFFARMRNRKRGGSDDDCSIANKFFSWAVKRRKNKLSGTVLSCGSFFRRFAPGLPQLAAFQKPQVPSQKVRGEGGGQKSQERAMQRVIDNRRGKIRSAQ